MGAQHRVDRPQPRRHPGLGRLGVARGPLELPRGGVWLGGLGGDHGEAGQGDLGGVSAGLGRSRPAAARPAACRRAPERLHDDHRVRLLVIAAAHQVAPVIEPEVAGDV